MFSIVIINFDGMKYWPECLAAIRAQRYPRGFEIIVVNNRSTDGSLEYLRQQDDVRIIDHGGNTGFSRGQNLGILASRGEYVLCLNFDCFLEPDFLAEVAKVFEARPEVGGVSGKLKKLVDGKRTDYIDSTAISFHCCRPADRGEWRCDSAYWNRPEYIFGPSGAAACYRRDALESVRYEDEFFDEEFFIYCEDIDLAWRLNLAGWKSWYQPTAVGYHERGSTRKDSPWERRNYFVTGFRNRLLAMYKNLRLREEFLPHWPTILGHELLQVVRWCRGGPKQAAIMGLALAKFAWKLVRSPRMRDKRRRIQRHRRDRDFSLGFDSPYRAGRPDLPDLNLYRNGNGTKPGPTLFVAEEVRTQNLTGGQPRAAADAVAGGRSCKGDPQFVVPVPPRAAGCGQALLEFELYSSRETYGQVIWMAEKGFCISESFEVRQGRHAYLLDLGSLPVLPGIGNPAARARPLRALRIDPTSENGVHLGIYGLRVCARANGSPAGAENT